MAKECVYIILSHKNTLKKYSKTEWDVEETVEFVNQIRNKHRSLSSAIGDYLNKKMITGSRFGMEDYDQFEGYIRKKYEKQMAELDTAYMKDQVSVPELVSVPEFSDQFGTSRPKTVFDV